ncbi:MAG: SpoIIE family protein phosphatase [Proteobacteria bacterium]|nr:SpoIIE family protein phosphatase [Pseudomonadota bacterium]
MKTDNYLSLASRLSRWIIPLGALILVSVLAANYFLSRHLLDYYVENLTKTTASSTVRKIETIFKAVATSADSLSSIVSTSDITEKQIHQTIKAFINTNTSIFGMTVALEPHTLITPLGDFSPYYYRDGNKLAFSDLADKSYNYQAKPWYVEPKQINAPVWSEPYFDEGGGGVRMITYSTPIYLPANKTFAGIATADIQLSWLDEIINEMKIGDSGFGFILSRDDVVIAHSDEAINLTKLTKDEVEPNKWQHYINSKEKTSAVYFKSSCSKKADSGACRFAIKSLSNSGWKVVIVLPEKELTAKINALTTKISIIAIFGLIILFIVVTSITRFLTKPLGQLASATKDIGAGYLDAEIPEPVREDEIGALTDDFSSMRKALKTYISEVQIATAKQQKLESEIQIAKDIQMSMIPGSGNAVIRNDEFQLFALLRPARSVGGDLYYFKQLDSTLHFILGDVSDKGVPAALFMAKTITLYTRALRDDLSPGKTLTLMNDILAQNNDACMFVTALCGHIDLNTGAVVMSNAGHMDPIIQDTQGTREQEVKGATALGLMEGIDYPDIEFQLGHEASMIMYTDGISEAHDIDSNQYSDEKLIDLITNIDTSNSEETGTTIIQSVDDFAADVEQFDDITIMIVRYE